jgi:transcriptional regulator of nitric oxide reductase
VKSSNTQIKIYAKALHTFSHIQLILTMLPWKLNKLLQGTQLLVAEHQATTKFDISIWVPKTKLNSVAFSPHSNYTDQATAACQRS